MEPIEWVNWVADTLWLVYDRITLQHPSHSLRTHSTAQQPFTAPLCYSNHQCIIHIPSPSHPPPPSHPHSYPTPKPTTRLSPHRPNPPPAPNSPYSIGPLPKPAPSCAFPIPFPKPMGGNPGGGGAKKPSGGGMPWPRWARSSGRGRRPGGMRIWCWKLGGGWTVGGWRCCCWWWWGCGW